MDKKNFIKYFFPALLVCVVLFGLVQLHSKTQSQLAPNSKYDPHTHYSVSSLKSGFDDAYAEAKPQESEEDATGIIVNHHLLGSKFIAESFAKIATSQAVTVLLISPNHFSAGSGSIITSKAIWKTPYGELSPDLTTIDNLASSHIASIEETPFEQEHGISGIVPFVKRSLPNAYIVPLIIREDLTIPKALELAEQIRSNLPAGTLIVGSFDFSHYLTHRAADFHDLTSLQVVQEFDYENIQRLDIDSHPGLALFLKLLELNQSQDFHLLENSNSATMARTDSILETTSYITGYFTKGQITTNIPRTETLLALGNIDASTNTIASLDRHNKSFSIKFLERLFFGQDTTTTFIEPYTKLEQQLAKLKINSPITSNKELNLGPLKIAYIYLEADQSSYDLAKTAIDNGADVVIVNGPLGDIETYKHKFIFKGLGELITKHTLSSSTISHSLSVGLAVTDSQLTIYLLPIEVNHGIAKLLTSPADDIVLKELSRKSKLNPDIKQQILSGVININLKDYGTK